MIESGRVTGKGRFRASTEKLSELASKNGRFGVSTRNWYNPGEYREKVDSVRVPKNCPDEYLTRVESVSIPKNGTIPASTGKR